MCVITYAKYSIIRGFVCLFFFRYIPPLLFPLQEHNNKVRNLEEKSLQWIVQFFCPEHIKVTQTTEFPPFPLGHNSIASWICSKILVMPKVILSLFLSHSIPFTVH